MKIKLSILIALILPFTEYVLAQTTNGMSIKDFESNIQQLQGKSPTEAIAKLGKPKDVDKTFSKDVGAIECHLYEGIKDQKSGTTVSTGNICFKNGKLYIKPESIIYRY